jgi:hypothetical protein
MTTLVSTLRNGGYTYIWMLHTSDPSQDDGGGVFLASGTNSGDGQFDWRASWQSEPNGSDVVGGSPIASDFTRSIYAIRSDGETSSLGRWLLSEAATLQWQEDIETVP